ncbi:MAG: Trk family potassium uptake protein [Pseudobutyrivibrio sp.]|nr:Trk family potassium uptake protein [Pseudobutyrivibrio sp.]
MLKLKKIKDSLSSFQIIILGFVGVILLGAVILMFPVSSADGVYTPFADALFTATSAVCVTGLVVYDTATYWSDFGQVIILILIQIGGLGVVTVASLLALLAGKKISLMQRQTMQNALSVPQVGGIVRLTKFIILTSFSIETCGALLLMPVFVPKYGIKGIWMSVFHSVSAFCNAGFDIMGSETGEFSSLTSFAYNPYITIVISALIIIGGLGFITWDDIVTKKFNLKAYRMQSKVIITTTLILIVVPAIIFFAFCFDGHSLEEKICLSVFQAITPRTAGFNTADLTSLPDIGIIITILLMLVGGSPGSTAGGMKTTTLAVLFSNIIAVFRKRESANYFGRRVDDSVVKNASALLMLYSTLAITSALVITQIDGISIKEGLFETFSAIGTVGLSLGVTPGLSHISHTILIILMFWGRVGGLTIIYAAFSNKDTTASKYPQESIMIG